MILRSKGDRHHLTSSLSSRPVDLLPTTMSLRSQILALASPKLDSDRALRQRSVAEAKESASSCDESRELVDVAIEAGKT